MHVIVDLCVVPLGVGVSVSKYVALCQQILEAAGLKTRLHAYGTNIEGVNTSRCLPRSAVATNRFMLPAHHASAQPLNWGPESIGNSRWKTSCAVSRKNVSRSE